MAVVKGPLFSVDATGTLAGTIVYSHWKGRNVIRRHATPANPRSGGQLSVRAMMQFLSQFWTNLSDGQKATWDDRAAVTNISPFNAYIAYNMARWGLNTTPSKSDPADETGVGDVLDTQVATAGSRSIHLSVNCSLHNDGWGILIYRRLTTGLTGLRNELVHAMPGESVATFTWLDSPLAVGVPQYYIFRGFTDEGDLGGPTPEVTATPAA